MNTEGEEKMQKTKEKVAGNEIPESEATRSEELESIYGAGNETLESKAAENAEIEDVIVRDKAGRKKRIFIILGAAIVLLAAVIIGISVFGGSDRKIQEQLDLGTKYLEEMDYEQALVAFNAVLEIDPKNADAYLGIVEVYIRTNEFELALETAKEGYEVTGDERLKEKIDMIESGDIFASNGWRMKLSGYDGAGNLVFWHEYTYNLKGQQASVANYNAQGVQEQYLELAYDEKGRELITYSYWWDDSEAGLDKKVIEYSGNNWRATIYNGTGDEITGYEDVEADADGKELKSTYYNADGSIGNIEVSEYNEAGNLIKRENYGADNSLWSYDIITYGGDGNRLQWQCYGADGTLLWYLEEIYDEEGNWMGTRHYDGDGTLTSEQIGQ